MKITARQKAGSTMVFFRRMAQSHPLFRISRCHLPILWAGIPKKIRRSCHHCCWRLWLGQQLWSRGVQLQRRPWQCWWFGLNFSALYLLSTSATREGWKIHEGRRPRKIDQKLFIWRKISSLLTHDEFVGIFHPSNWLSSYFSIFVMSSWAYFWWVHNHNFLNRWPTFIVSILIIE